MRAAAHDWVKRHWKPEMGLDCVVAVEREGETWNVPVTVEVSYSFKTSTEERTCPPRKWGVLPYKYYTAKGEARFGKVYTYQLAEVMAKAEKEGWNEQEGVGRYKCEYKIHACDPDGVWWECDVKAERRTCADFGGVIWMLHTERSEPVRSEDQDQGWKP